MKALKIKDIQKMCATDRVDSGTQSFRKKYFECTQRCQHFSSYLSLLNLSHL